MSLWALRLCSG